MKLFPKDPYDWAQHAECVQYVEGLSDYEKVQARDALTYLGAKLGNGFLAPSEDKGIHPISGLLNNVVPWTRRKLIMLAQDVRTLENAENVSKLLSGLKQPSLFDHNQLVLSCAGGLVREGLSARFEPTRPLGNGEKQPDIKLTNIPANENVYLEVAVTEASRKDSLIHERAWGLTERLFRAGAELRWCGKLHKTLAEPHWAEVLGRVDSAIVAASRDQRLVTVEELSTIALAVCPEAKVAELELWAQAHGIQPGELLGPPISLNHLDRLKNKIMNEQQQLPKDAASVLFIQNSDAFFFTRDIGALVSELEEEIYRFPQVAMLIVQGSSLGGEQPEVKQFGQHRYSRRIMAGDICEQNLLLVNRFCSKGLSMSTLSSFLRVF
jgi:hypothetical protein